MIKFHNVSKIYPHNSVALENINLEIKPYEFISLVGRSGAGKTTLLRLLIAEERPTRGRIFFNKEEVNKLNFNQLPVLRRKIGMVFQDFKLLSYKTIYENVAFALEVSGAGDEQIQSDTPQVLRLVGLKEKMENFPPQLSGGEKQRLSLARALINRPEVLIADEPTGNLDPVHTRDIIRLLLKINELGTTVILATHNKEIVNNLGRRVVTLEDGRLIRDEEKGKYIL